MPVCADTVSNASRGSVYYLAERDGLRRLMQEGGLAGRSRPAEEFHGYKVSKDVGNVRSQGPELITLIEAATDEGE